MISVHNVNLKCRGFETAIAANGGADPLSKWTEFDSMNEYPLFWLTSLSIYRYITWAHEEKTRGTVAVDYVLLLERCIKQFSSYEEYRDDERFLNVCLAYVSLRLIIIWLIINLPSS